MPDVDHLRSLVTARTRAIVMIDPNNPTGAVYPTSVRRAIIDVAERHDLTILADEVYGELGYEGPVPLLSTLDPDAPIISFSSLSKAYLAPGWRTGWLVVGATPRLDDALAAIKKMADGRLCSPGPMQHAVAPALLGDRSHQPAFRAALAERARVTTEMLNAIPGMRCVAPRGAFYAMPQVTLPARPHRRALRAVAAARDRHPLRLRLGVRRGARDGHVPHRLPGAAVRPADDLRRHRRLHGRLPRARLSRLATG